MAAERLTFAAWQFHLYACVEAALKALRRDGNLDAVHPEVPHSVRLLRRRYREEVYAWFDAWVRWHQGEYARLLALRNGVAPRNRHRRRWLRLRIDGALRDHRTTAIAVAAVCTAVTRPFHEPVEASPYCYLDAVTAR